MKVARVVLAVVRGAGRASSRSPSCLAPATDGAQARIAHLETLVKCPACEDLSVAQSNATSAIAVRHEIARRVRAGESDNQILTSLEDGLRHVDPAEPADVGRRRRCCGWCPSLVVVGARRGGRATREATMSRDAARLRDEIALREASLADAATRVRGG